jgi:AmmeMemoRadiSam system protein B
MVRRALGTGRWFPSDRHQLEKTVAGYIEAAGEQHLEGRIVGIIAPHAGFQFSGKVAGFAFRALKDAAAAGDVPETVVVLGFSHQAGFRGVALMDGAALRTPLGDAVIDGEAAELLVRNNGAVYLDYGPHRTEHSAENEIPFVQVALPRSKVVVGLIGDHEEETIRELLLGLSELESRKRIVVVASSDMLHDASYELVTQTDRATLARVAAMDISGLLGEWSYSRQVFCGISPVVALMRMAHQRGCTRGRVLHYRNSGDDHPDSRGNWVVGYGAVAFEATD